MKRSVHRRMTSSALGLQRVPLAAVGRGDPKRQDYPSAPCAQVTRLIIAGIRNRHYFVHCGDEEVETRLAQPVKGRAGIHIYVCLPPKGKRVRGQKRSKVNHICLASGLGVVPPCHTTSPVNRQPTPSYLSLVLY